MRAVGPLLALALLGGAWAACAEAPTSDADFVQPIFDRLAQMEASQRQAWLRQLEQRATRAARLTLRPDQATQQQAKTQAMLHQKAITWSALRAVIEDTRRREEIAIDLLVRRYRGQVFDTFHKQTNVYDQRQQAWLDVYNEWKNAGGRFEQQDRLIDWLEAALRSATPETIGPIPEKPTFEQAPPPVKPTPKKPAPDEPKPLAKPEPTPTTKPEPKQSTETEPKQPAKTEPTPPAKVEPTPPRETPSQPPKKTEPKPPAETPPQPPPEPSADVLPKRPAAVPPKRPAEVTPERPPAVARTQPAKATPRQPNAAASKPAVEALKREPPLKPRAARSPADDAEDSINTIPPRAAEPALPPPQPAVRSLPQRPAVAAAVRRLDAAELAPEGRVGPVPPAALRRQSNAIVAMNVSTATVAIPRSPLVQAAVSVPQLAPVESSPETATVSTEKPSPDAVEIKVDELAARIAGCNLAFRGLEADLDEKGPWTASRLEPLVDRLKILVGNRADLSLVRDAMPDQQRSTVARVASSKTAVSQLGARIFEARGLASGQNFQGAETDRQAELQRLEELSRRLAELAGK